MTDTLPPGFVLDRGESLNPVDTGNDVPPGFVLDTQSGTIQRNARGYAGDALRSAGNIGVGIERLPGFPQDMIDLAQAGISAGSDAITNRIFGEPSPEQRVGIDRIRASGPRLLPTSEQVGQAVQGLTGYREYEPETRVGKAVSNVAEFAPMALLGPGGRMGAFAKYAALPGVAGEEAERLSGGNPYAGPAAEILTGGLASLFSRPSTAAQFLKVRMPKGATSADIDQAEALITSAQSRGVNLTWPEALAKVTNNRVDLTDLQRVLEQSTGGRPGMTDFLHDRPARIQGAFADEMQAFSSGVAMVDPVQAGLNVQRASDRALTNLRKGINGVTDSLYRMASGKTVDPAAFQQLMADPLFASALAAVKSDPVFSRAVAGQGDMSVAMMDQIKKYLDNAASVSNRTGANFPAAVYGDLASDVKGAATKASGEYERALATQRDLRQKYLEPAEAGPLGKMSETGDLQKQATALLASKPSEGSDRIVAQTVRRLVKEDAPAAFQLIRDRLATAFNESAQATRAGPNAWGGANFAAAVRGNDLQARNLRAAVRALPGGDIRWQGLDDLLNVLEATGKRQAAGSGTAFNQQAMKELEGGTTIGTAVSLTPLTRIPEYIRNRYEMFRMGKNTKDLARIITDPGAAPLFRKLLSAKSLADREAAAARLVYYTLEGTKEIEGRPPG